MQLGRSAISHHSRIWLPKPAGDRLLPVLVARNVKSLREHVSSTACSSRCTGRSIKMLAGPSVLVRRYLMRPPETFPQPSFTASTRAAPV